MIELAKIIQTVIDIFKYKNLIASETRKYVLLKLCDLST